MSLIRVYFRIESRFYNKCSTTIVAVAIVNSRCILFIMWLHYTWNIEYHKQQKIRRANTPFSLYYSTNIILVGNSSVSKKLQFMVQTDTYNFGIEYHKLMRPYMCNINLPIIPEDVMINKNVCFKIYVR